MKEYIISALGEIHSVLLLACGEDAPYLTRDRAIAILPDSRSVSDVVAKDVGRIPYTDWKIRFILSYFFRTALGYPSCELFGEVDGRQINLEIFDTPLGVCEYRCERCKLLCTSRYVAPDRTEHTIYTVDSGAAVRVIHAENADNFSQNLLPDLKAIAGLPFAPYAVCICRDRQTLTDGAQPCPQHLISAAFTCVKENGESLELFSCGVSYTVAFYDGAAFLRTPATLVEVKQI